MPQPIDGLQVATFWQIIQNG